MTKTSSERSWIRAFLSLIVPGAGQALAGNLTRGFYIFLGVTSLSGLTVYTMATRARYPDYALSFQVFWKLLLISAALLIVLGIIYELVARSLPSDEFSRNLTKTGFVVLAMVVFGLMTAPVLDLVVPADKMLQLYGGTAFATAGVIAAIWLWNVADALVYSPEREPSTGAYILLLILALSFLGVRLVQIDLNKAVLEYKDTEVILSRLVWPWKAAFNYEADELRASAKIEAPCTYPDEAPPVNEPAEDGPWVRVTPTCGEVSVRDNKGQLTYGTLLTIEGGGFTPGETVTLRWENPIGNSFTPRGVGETKIQIDENGTFSSELYVPDVVIPKVSEGPQYHTLYVIQSAGERFSGQVSNDLILALKAILETIMMGLMATFAGIILSVPLSFLAARNLMQSITTTTQGFVGGVIGLGLGGALGRLLGRVVSGWWGGLKGAPLLTASVYFIFILAGALIFYRLLSRALDNLAQRLSAGSARLISLAGMMVIGVVAGGILGVLYAKGIVSITRGDAAVAAAIPQARLIGAVLGALAFLAWGIQLSKLDKLPVGMIVYTVVRLVLNIIRSIEPLIWAVMGVIWVGPGPFAGFIALTIHSVAALGKLYSESIESINEGPIEALQSVGANRLQTIIYAVVPQVLPPFTSFTLYRWDINVRMSTIIGMVGGGGIGFLLIQWIRQFQYLQAGMAVWMIAITVAILDFVSASIREKMV